MYVNSKFGPNNHTIRQVMLKRQSEISIQVRKTLSLKLRLVDGNAEIFGYELPLDVWLTMPPLMIFSVFSWYGATIDIDGDAETDYTSYEAPMMMSYLNLHNTLQVQRHRATTSPTSHSQGPRVIIVGDSDSGKTTLAKMLLSWAAKDGSKPIFVDLNIGQSSITIPGTVAATPIETPVDPVEGFPLDKAIVHYFGHTTPTNNMRLYKTHVEDLAQELEQEFAGNAKYRHSGMVIDTMGWVDNVGYELLVHAIRKFNASLVIVLGQEEELLIKLKKAFKFGRNVQVLNLEKSSSVFSRSTSFRRTLRNSNIKKYFCGAANDLTVYTKTAKFNDIEVYRIGEFEESTSSRLATPRGKNPMKITFVEICEHLVNNVLAISYAKQPNQIISSIVAGFVCITKVDMGEEIITYMSPSISDLPSKILVMGTLTWNET
ncbi:unnamed protein product [Cochlearia groenlandica]